MFNKLNKRIYGLIMLVSTVLIVFILLFAYIVTAGTLTEVMLSNICNTSGRSVLSSQIAINSALNFTKNIARKQSTINALKTGNYSTVASDLSALQNSSEYISAAILYSTNNIAQYTTSTGGVPLLSNLKSNQSLKDFFESNMQEFVSVRKSDIAAVYGFNLYNSEEGIISCCVKVIDDDGTAVGFLFSDILPSSLYKTDFNFFRYSQAENETILSNQSAVLFSRANFDISQNAQKYSLVAEQQAKIVDSFAVVEMQLLDELNVVFVVSIKNYYINLAMLASIFVGLLVVLIFCSHLVAKRFAHSITTPLANLSEKMRRQQLPK